MRTHNSDNLVTSPRMAGGPAEIGGPGRRRGSASRRYNFTEPLLDELRLAYCAAGKTELSASLARLVRRTGWPKYIFKTEAQRQGWAADYRPWTPDEQAFISEHAGALSIKEIARHLKRTHESVTAQVGAVQLIQQQSQGHAYTPGELAKLFGAGPGKVRRWIEKGLLGASRSFSLEMRVSQTDLLRFVENCGSEYDLARVHQEWFKALLFRGKVTEGV